MTRLPIALSLGAIAAVLLVIGCGSLTAHRARSGMNPPLHIHFRATDGVLLDGRLFGAGTTAVVFSHMGNPGNSQADWYSTARLLARRGYLALTYNRRGVCLEDGSSCSGGDDDYANSWKDVVGAYRYVKSRGAKHVILVGASVGAMSSLYAASLKDVEISGLIEIAGINHYSGYGFTAEQVASVEGEKLFVSADNDPWGGADAAREWHVWAEPPKQLLLLRSDKHGTDLLQRGEPTRARLTGEILSFVEKTASA